MNKVIIRIKGGLGNQLFCYAAARRLALVNNAELAIDHVSGFVRDRQYQRRYELDCFSIPARKATRCERLEPFERYRRGLKKWYWRRKPFNHRKYLEQEEVEYDERIMHFKVAGVFYMDGYWQSEGYFKDIEGTIRSDLRIRNIIDSNVQTMAERIRRCQAVAVHVRYFDAPGSNGVHNVASDYYARAIERMEREVENAHYFLFSDHPEVAKTIIPVQSNRITCVSQIGNQENTYNDLWLMTLCRHFIMANSTFSWWGAWLGDCVNKIVVAPAFVKSGGICAWGFKGLIPDNWTTV